MSLRSHLKDWKIKAKYYQPVIKTLLTSLIDKFGGLFNRATLPRKRVSELFDGKFGSDAYILATLFDPQFCLQWLDIGVHASATDKEALRKEVVSKYTLSLKQSYKMYIVASALSILRAKYVDIA